MKINKVLILTTNYGDGHIKTASSLLKQLKEYNPSIDVKVVNLFDEAHPLINKIIRHTYFKCYSYLPKLYDFIYFLTKHPARNLYYNNIQGLLGRKKLKEYLNSYMPDLVINTYSVLAMPMLFKKGYTKIPCYTIVTDYGAHSQWIDSGVHKYFVAHECVKNEMVEWGVDESKIEVSGIPIHLECTEELSSEDIRKKYGIENNNLPLVTLLGGANSIMRNMSEICEKFYTAKIEAQFVIVCGKNTALKEKLERELSKFSDRIKIFGYVDNLHEIMKASDIVVSKPGGITVTEMLSLETPMIIYGSPAGQEKENEKFLLENRCAFRARDINDMVQILSNLNSKTEVLKKMKQNTSEAKRPYGCSIIVESIIQDFENSSDFKKDISGGLSKAIRLSYGDIS